MLVVNDVRGGGGGKKNLFHCTGVHERNRREGIEILKDGSESLTPSLPGDFCSWNPKGGLLGPL